MNLNGILPPIATPFTPTGDLDLDALRFNVARWMRTRLRGVVALGSNGEAAYLDDDEAERIIATVREGVPRDRVLVAGAGRDATRATVEACRRAARAGADAVLVRAPTAFKPQMTADALVSHYTVVADASPVPVLLYNFPAAFGVSIPIETVVRMAEHPNVAGLKESSGDIAFIADCVSRTPAEFVVVVGSAPTLYASLCVGAAGGVVVAANVIPERFVELHEATARGDHAEALRLQRAVTPLGRAVGSQWGIAALKAAMSLAGYRGGWPRAPLQPAPPAVVQQLRAMLDAVAVSSDGARVGAS